MSSLISRMVLSLFSGHNDPAPTSSIPYVLVLQNSSKNPDLTNINPPGKFNVSPLYSVATSNTMKSNVILFRGDPDPKSTVGDAHFHSHSSTTDLMLHGQPMRMKMNQITGTFTIRHPIMGDLKWKAHDLTGSSLELRDGGGRKLARLKSGGLRKSGKKFEILVPCQDSFVELVLLSGMAAKAVKKATDEALAEVLGAVGDVAGALA